MILNMIKRKRQTLIKQQTTNYQEKEKQLFHNLVKVLTTQRILNQTQLNLMMLIKPLITLIILMIKTKTIQI
jgi:hypothetical protein